MTAKKLPKIEMNAYDSLFEGNDRNLQEQDKVMDIPLNQIDDFKGHPFHVRDDEDMKKLSNSIFEKGVLVPILLRQQSNGRYEIVSGHRRKHASIYNEIETIPAIVKELDDDEATIIMVDSNIQRENILPSERGFAYKMRYDAMSSQGKRNDLLSSSQLGTKFTRTDEILSKQYGESRNQMQRYMRLTYLIPELIAYVDGLREDKKKIAFNPAVYLSFLSKNEQKLVLKYMEEFETAPTLSQAQRMKELSKENLLEDSTVFEIMTEEKANQKEKLILKGEEIDRYFPRSFTPRQKTETIKKLLADWARKLERANKIER